MDGGRFDALTRSMTLTRPRRSVLRALAAGALGALVGPLAPASAADECGRDGDLCRRSGQCCGRLRCAGGKCCPPNRVFVTCPEENLCGPEDNLCCAGEDEAPSFCCPEKQVCGDRCCGRDFRCIDGVCKCILSNPLNCPSGGGGFYRVRRW